MCFLSIGNQKYLLKANTPGDFSYISMAQHIFLSGILNSSGNHLRVRFIPRTSFWIFAGIGRQVMKSTLVTFGIKIKISITEAYGTQCFLLCFKDLRKCRLSQEARGVASQKTAFFMVTAVKTSKIT
jgi:hypothetical protein